MEEKQGIDKFFKAMFENDGPDQPWLVPEDSVFEQAMDQVNKKRKSRRFFWLIPALLLLGSIAAYVWWSHGRIHDLEEKLDSISSQIAVKPKRKNNTTGYALAPDRNEPSDDIAAPEAPAERNSLPAIPNQPVPQAISSRAGNISGKTPIENTVSARLESGQITESISRETSDDTEEVTVLPKLKKHEDWALQPLQLPEQTLHYDRNPEQSLSTFPVNVKTEKPKARWEMTFTGGIRWSYFSMKSMQPAGSLEEYDKYYPGYFAELELSGRMGKRWEVFLSLGGEKMTNKSVYRTNKMFDSTEVVFSSSGMRYKSDVDVVTPLSNRTQQLDMDVDMSNIHDKDIFNCVLDVEHSIWLINAGAGIRYSIFNNNKFEAGLETALNYKWRITARESADFQMYHNKNMLFREGNRFDLRSNTTRGFATFQLGVFSKIFWNERVFSGAALGISRAISPMAKASDNYPASTYAHGLSISISTGIKF